MRCLSLASILGVASAILPFVSSVKVGDKVRWCSPAILLFVIQRAWNCACAPHSKGTHDTAVSTCITLVNAPIIITWGTSVRKKLNIDLLLVVVRHSTFPLLDDHWRYIMNLSGFCVWFGLWAPWCHFVLGDNRRTYIYSTIYTPANFDICDIINFLQK
jgi:hypothetical protein